MARLQGFLMRYKQDPAQAVRMAADLREEILHAEASQGPDSSPPARHLPAHSGRRRVLTVAEIDKMPFNPQPGWDKDVTVIG